MTYALWTVQWLLALLFIWAGGMKLVLPLEQMTGPVALPGFFLRFIGVAELLGGLGLVLPGLLLRSGSGLTPLAAGVVLGPLGLVLAFLLRIGPGLTPLAAVGLVVIMVGATAVTLIGGGGALVLMPVVIGLLAAFVAYGRWRLAPHRGSSRPSALQPAR